MSPTCIRKAEPSDINPMIRLLEQLFSIEEDFTFNETVQQKGLVMMLDDSEDRCIMVASSGDQIIGMCSVQLIASTAEGGIVALIEDMIVAQRFQRQGIGKKLMHAIEAWARQKGVKRMQLLADRNNVKALDFYKKQKWSATQLICLRKT
ncbi:MAG: GNAT family N-acetyltransferase [Thermodesulfobacteriota bacterium]|nr:GNAT family N-acetyltransferase [Thermodesulfobacteriota bacterium]